jgi:hypothetical protein
MTKMVGMTNDIGAVARHIARRASSGVAVSPYLSNALAAEKCATFGKISFGHGVSRRVSFAQHLRTGIKPGPT